MFKWLQAMIGKSSKTSESLMKEMAQKAKISEKDLALLKEELNKIVITATGYNKVKDIDQNAFLKIQKKDSKGLIIPLRGVFSIDGESKAFYFDEHKATSIGPYCELGMVDYDEFPIQEYYQKVTVKSLPIWEEVIHRYPELHKLIVKLAPEFPWTLYKTAKSQLITPTPLIQLGGYPQWIINDIDFRKIKGKELKFQYLNSRSRKGYFEFESEGNLGDLCFFQRD